MSVKFKKIILIITTLLVALCAVACKTPSQESETGPNHPPVLNELVLELEVGETFDLDVLNLTGV